MRTGSLRSASQVLKGSVNRAPRPSGVSPAAALRTSWFNTSRRHTCPTSAATAASASAARWTRGYATPAPMVNESHLTNDQYHALSDTTMDALLENLEELIDHSGDPSLEVDYHSGVLTLELGAHGTYVINKQPPNKQIWLSSPFSGPKRYDYSEELDDWIYLRDGQAMGDLLNQELSTALGREVNLGVDHISSKVEEE